jgi:hypothetical protein
MRNEISGGNFFGPIIQVGNVHGDIAIRLPAEIPLALGGLPRASPTFTGRGAVLDDLLAMLGPSDVRKGVVQVSAVSGMGGVGKTELALQAAHAAREKGWFPGGVLFVDLLGYDERLRVEPAVALDGFLRALGVPAEDIPSDLQGRERLYRSVLDAYAHSGRDVLVLIDNAFPRNRPAPCCLGSRRHERLSRHTLAELGARLVDLPRLSLAPRGRSLGSPGSPPKMSSRKDGEVLVRLGDPPSPVGHLRTPPARGSQALPPPAPDGLRTTSTTLPSLGTRAFQTLLQTAVAKWVDRVDGGRLAWALPYVRTSRA